jgi:ketosteroid isomerase-like protein
MDKISAEDVRKEVHRFWGILSGKLQGKLGEMYSPTAIIFTGKAKRSESARLVAVRRSRQAPGAASAAKAEVGSIDVQIVEPDVAIAVYTYAYNIQKTNADGTKVQLNTPYGRATQIFQRDEGGKLHIVHEHLSAGAPPAVEQVAE